MLFGWKIKLPIGWGQKLSTLVQAAQIKPRWRLEQETLQARETKSVLGWGGNSKNAAPALEEMQCFMYPARQQT